MTFPSDPNDRLPRGDKNRRLSVGLSNDEMAAICGLTTRQLRYYEFTQPDHGFDVAVAARVGEALEMLERTRVPLVSNGPVPHGR
jgi:hypothetical protein